MTAIELLNSGDAQKILLAGLAVLLGLLGGWLGAYFNVKGKNLATREDYEDALEQLRRNTETVEDVKEKLSDQARRVTKSSEYVARQIEEFYGPIFNLVHQIVVVNHVQHAILSRKPETGPLPVSQQSEVIKFFQEKYFFLIHRELNEILKTKLYLIEGTELPRSYYAYLRHAIQEQAQTELWSERQIDTSYVQGVPYPNELYDAVKQDLDILMQRYESLTRMEMDSLIDNGQTNSPAIDMDRATLHRADHA